MYSYSLHVTKPLLLYTSMLTIPGPEIKLVGLDLILGLLYIIYINDSMVEGLFIDPISTYIRLNFLPLKGVMEEGCFD